MGTTQHIIELNGKRYDTVSGKVISSIPTTTKAIKSSAPKTAKVLDGFARRRPGSAKSVPLRKTEKSKTLMRSVVQKPQPIVSSATSEPKQIESFRTISSAKLAHAQSVTKSALVKRFGGEIASVSHKQAAAKTSVKPVERIHAVATATVVPADPLADGLAKATSHEQQKLKKVRAHSRFAKRLRISPKLVSGGALALAALLIGGFFAYQNIPNLNMRLASARSGVHGSLPSYTPAGFSQIGKVSYKPGLITVGFKSNSDNRKFTLTQSVSSWDSQTLRDNLTHDQKVASPITVPDNGKTLYIWDSNATWVDAGTLYKIEGDSKLNSDQLLRLANSL